MKKKFLIYVILLITNIFILVSCSKPIKPRVTSKDELYLFLDSLEMRYENAYKKMQVALWNKCTNENHPDFTKPRLEFTEIFLDTNIHQIIAEWRDRSGSLADKILARRLELWYRCFIGGSILFDPEINNLENSLQKKIEDFKFPYEGNLFSLSQFEILLQEEKKQKNRRKLWNSQLIVSEDIKKEFIELIKLRNKKAFHYRFPNYFSVMLYLQAIDENWLIETLKSLEELTLEPYEKKLTLIKKRLHIKDFYPWDTRIAEKEITGLYNKFFQKDSSISIIHKFEKNIGFNINSLPIKETIHRLNHNKCFIFSIPAEINLLIHTQNGIGFYKIALHEYGNAIRATHINVVYPILKGYNVIPGTFCPAYHYGVAQIHSEFIDDSLWLTQYTNMQEKDIKRYLTKDNATEIIKLRRTMIEFFIEYELYKNPNINIDSLENHTIQKYLLCKVDKNLNIKFVPLLKYITKPCSNHEWILGNMLSAQVHEAIKGKYNEVRNSSPEVGKEMIKHLYSTGEILEWYERLRNATGKSLDPGAYLRKLGIEHMEPVNKDNN